MQFPREYNGQFADNDIYVDCNKGVKIFYYGKSILQCYVPSLKQGRTIVRTIYRDFVNKNNTETTVNEHEVKKDGGTISVTKESISIKNKDVFMDDLLNNDYLFDIEETDEELLFKFHSKHMNELVSILKPKTSGADRSPFSSKNLPKAKYEIPLEDMDKYKSIVSVIGNNRLLELSHITKSFLQSLVTKKNSWENIKDDMAKKMLKGKEYIHSIGKWNEYLNYLENNL